MPSMRSNGSWEVSRGSAEKGNRVKAQIRDVAKHCKSPQERMPKGKGDRALAAKIEQRWKDWMDGGCHNVDWQGKPLPDETKELSANDLIDLWWPTKKAKIATKRRDNQTGTESLLKAAKAFLEGMPATALEDPATFFALVASYHKQGKLVQPFRIIATILGPTIRWALAQTHERRKRGEAPLLVAKPFGPYLFDMTALRHDAEKKSAARKTLRQRVLPALEHEMLDACAVLNDVEYDYCGSYLADFIVLALDLGGRIDEILGLTNATVDWDAHTVTFLNTKRNGENRVVPFNPKGRVAAILKRRKFAGPTGAVIADRKGKGLKCIQKSWVHMVCLTHHFPYVLNEKGRPDAATMGAYTPLNLTAHKLRHEAITWMAKCKVPKEDREFMEGHISQSDEHGKYSHEKMDRLIEALRTKVWPREQLRNTLAVIDLEATA